MDGELESIAMQGPKLLPCVLDWGRGGRRGGMVAEGVPRFGLREFRGTERGAKQAKACKRKEKEWRNQQEKPQEGGRLAASNGST